MRDDSFVNYIHTWGLKELFTETDYVGIGFAAWTNDRSILHRVVINKDKGRSSFAYFCFPASGLEADYLIKPITKLINEENPPNFVPFSYLELIFPQKDARQEPNVAPDPCKPESYMDFKVYAKPAITKSFDF